MNLEILERNQYIANFKKIPLANARQMAQIDAHAIKNYISSINLMQNAGGAAVSVIIERFEPQTVLVLCGAGNNGGDGFVIARKLAYHGFDVTISIIGDRRSIKGDALISLKKLQDCGGKIVKFTAKLVHQYSLIIDAIFGTGLDRNLDDAHCAIVNQINGAKATKIAIDLPSGVNASNGSVMKDAIKADLTLSFALPKLGCFLLPAKEYVGKLVVLDIKISPESIKEAQIKVFLNDFKLFKDVRLFTGANGHKYNNGHLGVFGSNLTKSGAARLTSLAALNCGVGLLSVAVNEETLPIYALSAPEIMCEEINDDNLDDFINHSKKDAFVIGPGAGVDEITFNRVLHLLQSKKPVVLDADALSIFEDDEEGVLAKNLHRKCVLTPHFAEFKRALSNQAENSKVNLALKAAQNSKTTIVLKGNDTVIACFDGSVIVNDGAPSSLAKGGSGDVLSGIIGSLLAKNINPFLASALGVLIHSKAAQKCDNSMNASDLIKAIKEVMADIY